TADDMLMGGEGLDTATFSGSVFDYAIKRYVGGLANVLDKIKGRDGDDVTQGVEQLAFQDRTLYLQTGVNNAPISRPDAFTVRYNQELRIPISRVVANDMDFDGDPLTVEIEKEGSQGLNEAGGASLTNGMITYRPPDDIQWALTEGNKIEHSFDYEVS